MTSPTESSETVAELAATHPGAARVLFKKGLDFCCRGGVPFTDACKKAGLDPDAVKAEIEEESKTTTEFERWDEKPSPELITHILDHFHEAHRKDVPPLIKAAQKVEDVHRDKESCPKGLAAHLEHMGRELELHMQKEEQVLFPLLRSGAGAMAQGPIHVMMEEHHEHARNLQQLRRLTTNYQTPEEACSTWRTLYSELERLEFMLNQHIHLENHVLFPRFAS